MKPEKKDGFSVMKIEKHKTKKNNEMYKTIFHCINIFCWGMSLLKPQNE